MNKIDQGRAAQAMAQYGGGFVKALATCWLRADVNNRQRLVDAFPELFDRYLFQHVAEEAATARGE